jgi:hypothetical protein
MSDTETVRYDSPREELEEMFRETAEEVISERLPDGELVTVEELEEMDEGAGE